MEHKSKSPKSVEEGNQLSDLWTAEGSLLLVRRTAERNLPIVEKNVHRRNVVLMMVAGGRSFVVVAHV